MTTNTTSEYQLSLTAKELQTLLIVLEQAFKETQSELAHTDLRHAKKVVHEHEEVIQTILKNARRLEQR